MYAPPMDGLEVGVDERDGIVTIRLVGELDMATREKLAPLRATLDRHPAEVVVDMTELKFLDSSGLRGILNGCLIADSLGVRYRCTGIQPQIRRMLEVVGVLETLHAD